MALAIPRGEVHVWYADPDRVLDGDPLLLPRLSDEEKVLLERRTHARARREYLVTRALLRQTLSRYADVEPLAWQFSCGEHGKPSVNAPEFPFHFNLTHTHGLIALAIAGDRELWIDAEDLERRAPLEISHRYFATPEADALRALPSEAQPERFFLLWTLKEAYLKACARGLTVPLSHFWVDLDGEAPRLRFSPQLDEDATRWQTVAWRPTSRHQLALALPAKRPPLLRERWVAFE